MAQHYKLLAENQQHVRKGIHETYFERRVYYEIGRYYVRGPSPPPPPPPPQIEPTSATEARQDDLERDPGPSIPKGVPANLANGVYGQTAPVISTTNHTPYSRTNGTDHVNGSTQQPVSVVNILEHISNRIKKQENSSPDEQTLQGRSTGLRDSNGLNQLDKFTTEKDKQNSHRTMIRRTRSEEI